MKSKRSLALAGVLFVGLAFAGVGLFTDLIPGSYQVRTFVARQLGRIAEEMGVHVGRVDGASASSGGSYFDKAVRALLASVAPNQVPDQAIESLAGELPAHDPTVTTGLGSAGVSGGSASYEIPIALPPGRNGMQPSVSLSYGSRSGNGIAGMGWNISGQSSISRCPSTLEQDGVIKPVDLTSNDKLCLDGQRLLTTSGTYGAVNATYDTELDSFVRVTQLGSNLGAATSYFKVELKSGEILYYGATSTAASNGRVIPGGVTAPLTWLLVRKEDRVGNSMKYVYANLGNGENFLQNIYYTGTATVDGDRHVDFTYETRPTGTGANDQSSSYIAGGLIRQTQRLQKISTWAGTEHVRDYVLNYTVSTSTGRSLLSNVQECGFTGTVATCRTPVNFSWQQGAPTYSFHEDSAAASLGRTVMIRPLGDINGDGAREVVWSGYNGSTGQAEVRLVTLTPERSVSWSMLLSDASLTVAPKSYFLKTADFDNDGREDIVKYGPSGIAVDFWRGPNTATTYSSAFTVTWQTGIAGNAEYTGDMNGDGRADIVVTQASPVGLSGCATGVSTYLNTAPPTPGAQATFVLSTSNCLDSTQFPGFTLTVDRVQDINGDGLPDIWIRSADRGSGTHLARVLLGSRNGGYSQSNKDFVNFFPGSDPITSQENSDGFFSLWPDVNGDGLSDMVYARLASDGTGRWTIRLNQGTGFGPRLLLQDRNGIERCSQGNGLGCAGSAVFSPRYAGKMTTGDYDADGRDEIFIPRRFAARICAFHRSECGNTPGTTASSKGTSAYSGSGRRDIAKMIVGGGGPSTQSKSCLDFDACPEDPVTGSLEVSSATLVVDEDRDGVYDQNHDGVVSAADGQYYDVVGLGAISKEIRTFFHYTDEAGAKGISESGVIIPDARGRVYLTDQRLSPADVQNRLFVGRSGDAEKGSHVVEIQAPADLPVRQGKNSNELYHQGAIRDGRQGTTLTVKANDF